MRFEPSSRQSRDIRVAPSTARPSLASSAARDIDDHEVGLVAGAGSSPAPVRARPEVDPDAWRTNPSVGGMWLPPPYYAEGIGERGGAASLRDSPKEQ